MNRKPKCPLQHDFSDIHQEGLTERLYAAHFRRVILRYFMMDAIHVLVSGPGVSELIDVYTCFHASSGE